MLAEGERATGLQLPEDIETLLGDGVSMSVDAGADLKALSRVAGPGHGAGGHAHPGRPGEDHRRSSTGSRRPPARAASLVHVACGDGVVAVGTDPDYIDQLLAEGNLGSRQAFGDVVPEADRANARGST